jgi:hypothetical protein
MPRMTRQDFEDALALLRPGEKVCYHTGSLMRDRVQGLDFGKVNNVAHAAFLALEAGKVHLTQRYIGDGRYDYLAVKRPPPFKPVEWTGCYDPDRTSIKKAKPLPASVVV